MKRFFFTGLIFSIALAFLGTPAFSGFMWGDWNRALAPTLDRACTPGPGYGACRQAEIGGTGVKWIGPKHINRNAFSW